MADKELLDVELKLRNLKEAQKFTEYMKEADKSAGNIKKQMASMKAQLKQLSTEAIAFQRALKIPPAQAAKLIQTGGVNASLTNAQTKGQINQFKAQAQQVNATLINTYTKGFKDLLRAADNARVLALTRTRQTTPGSDLQTVRDQLAAQRFRVAERSQTLNPNNQNHLKALATETKLVQNLEAAEKKLIARERERLAVARQQQSINQAANSARLRSQNKELLAASREFSVQRTTGDGGASLFKIQGQLLANYLIMNKVFQLFNFGTQFVLQLDQAFRQLQAITATTETEMVGLREELIKVSEQTKFTAVEVAEAATVLGQAGFSTTEIRESIQDVTFLATAVGTDLKTAVDLTTSTLSIFNLRAEETGHVANVLTGAINNSKLTLDKLTLGLQFAGNTAAQAGATFEETVSVLGAMANAGIRSGSTLGTGLRQVLVSFLKPTKKMQTELEKVGLTMEDIDVKSNGLVNVFQTLSDAGFGASNAFAGMQVRAAAAFLAVSNNLDVARELEEVLLLTNAAAEANEVQMRSLSNSLDKFRSILGTVIVRFSEPFKEFLISATNLIGGMLSALGNLGALLPIIGTGLIGLGSAIAIKRLGLLVKNLFDVNIFARKAGVSVAFLGAASGKSAVGVRLLGAATSFLKANLVSLTIGGLIAATTAFKTFGPSAEDAAARLDRLKAAVDQADGAMETTNGRIASVDERIQRLSNRYSVLTEDSAALAVEVLKAEVEFGKFGLTIQEMENPVDGLIEGLRELKQEFLEIKQIELDSIRVNRINLIEEKSRVARDRASGLLKKGSFFSPSSNNASLGLTDKLRGATSSALQSTSEFERLSLIDANKLNNAQIETEYIKPLNELRRQLNGSYKDVTEELTRLQQLATANPALNEGPFPTLGEGKLNDIIEFKTSLELLIASVNDLQGSAKSLRLDNTSIEQGKFDATASARAVDEFITSISNGTSQITDSLKGVSDPTERQEKLNEVQENIQDITEVSEDYLNSLIDVDEIKKVFGKELGEEQLSKLLATRQASLNVALAERANVEEGIKEQTDAYVKDLDALNIKILEQRIKLLRNKASKATNTDDIKMLNDQIEEDLVEINSIKQRAIAKELADEGITAKQGELLKGQSELLDNELSNDIDNLGQNLSKFRDKFIDIGKELEKSVDKLDEIKKIGEDVSFDTDLKIQKLQSQIEANGDGGALEGRFGSTQIIKFQDQIKQLERERLRDTEAALAEQQRQIDELIVQRSSRAASTEAAARGANPYGDNTQEKIREAKEARKELTAAEEEAIRVGRELAQVRAEIAGQDGNTADAADSEIQQVTDAIQQWGREAAKFDIGENVKEQLDNAKSAFGTFITDVTSGTKSVKESFKDMARSIIESLQKVVTEWLITQIVTAAFGGGGAGGGFLSGFLGLNDGGFIRKNDGGAIKRAALGTANPNRDSVPILARPGEYVLRNSAVQMLGRENLDQMNALGNRRISKSAPPSAVGAMQTEPDTVNVYVVSPEQKPQMTPKDVVVAVSEDLAKGGQTKKLVKSIQMGKS